MEYGYRYMQLRWEDGNIVFTSPFASGRPGWIDNKFDAACDRKIYHFGDDKDLIPNENCSCGIYSLSTIEEVVKEYGSSVSHNGLITRVALWGRIIIGARGARAEHAQIDTVFAPFCQPCRDRSIYKAAEFIVHLNTNITGYCQEHMDANLPYTEIGISINPLPLAHLKYAMDLEINYDYANNYEDARQKIIEEEKEKKRLQTYIFLLNNKLSYATRVWDRKWLSPENRRFVQQLRKSLTDAGLSMKDARSCALYIFERMYYSTANQVTYKQIRAYTQDPLFNTTTVVPGHTQWYPRQNYEGIVAAANNPLISAQWLNEQRLVDAYKRLVLQKGGS